MTYFRSDHFNEGGSKEQCAVHPPEGAPDASSRMFREYAAEFLQLARSATSTEARFLYIKMASIWQETAVRWERDLLRDQEKLGRASDAEHKIGLVDVGVLKPITGNEG
jgi:hypothetical protein